MVALTALPVRHPVLLRSGIHEPGSSRGDAVPLSLAM